jgi:hypothetical protein
MPLRFSDSELYVFGPRMADSDVEGVLNQALLPSVLPFTMREILSVCQIQNVQSGQMILLTTPSVPRSQQH